MKLKKAGKFGKIYKVITCLVFPGSPPILALFKARKYSYIKSSLKLGALLKIKVSQEHIEQVTQTNGLRYSGVHSL